MKQLHDHRLVVVLISLLALILSHAICENWDGGRIYYHLIFDLVLLASLFAVSQSRATLVVATVLGIPVFMVYWTSLVPGVQRIFVSPIYDAISFFLMAGFLTVIAAFILWFVMRSRRITVNILCGAISVYLLFGLIGGNLYSGLDKLDNRSFVIVPQLLKTPEGKRIDDYQRSSLLNYFSFVSLSTLGYGDIYPYSPLARTLSSLQAILGQLYLAVMIARLVGLHIVFDNKREIALTSATDTQRSSEKNSRQDAAE